MADFSKTFDVPSLSDARLVLVRKSGDVPKRKRDAQGSGPLRTFCVSKVILTQSEYFETLILRWKPREETEPARKGRGRGTGGVPQQ